MNLYKANKPHVTLDGNDRSADWAGFTLTLGDKSYTTSSSSAPEVWPASGTWEFGKNADNSVNVNVLVRDDGVEIQNSVTESSLTLQFTYTAPGGISLQLLYKKSPLCSGLFYCPRS